MKSPKLSPLFALGIAAFVRGMDHHWMPECDDEDDGEPIMMCKHCGAVREYTDEDDEF